MLFSYPGFLTKPGVLPATAPAEPESLSAILEDVDRLIVPGVRRYHNTFDSHADRSTMDYGEGSALGYTNSSIANTSLAISWCDACMPHRCVTTLI